MPVSAVIDTDAGLVRYTASGQPTVAEITAALGRIYGKSEFRRGMGVVWDGRDATVGHLSIDGIQEILRYIAEQLDTRGLGRTAIVVSEDADHAVASMFDGHVDGVPIERRVFRDLDEATLWASRPYWDDEEP
jgi:hypothetical protein